MARNKWGRQEGSGGGEGTDNYNDLNNKPKINGHTLSGNKTASDLGLASAEDLEGKIDTPESAGSEGQVLTLDENGNPVWEDPQGGGGEINVIDNLNSDSATDALSAKQGKALKGLVDGKVDKVTGKGLSTNDYTTEDKDKVETALQPSALTSYRTASNQDTIDNAIKGRLDTIEGKESGWDGKQDAISDLDDIRQGAEDGTEALSKALNPVSKTSGMTQAVGKDEDGRLWTTPGGGGGGGAVDSVNGMTGDVVLGASDVGALPDTTTVPSALSQLTDDSTHRTVTDSEKSTWNDKANKVAKRVVTELTSAIELQPNEMCVLTNVGTTLAVTLATPADNSIVNEYMLEFETGSTPPSVSFPGTVVFPTALSVKANKHYQFSIIDNIALYISA